jgi:hypothetical protein
MQDSFRKSTITLPLFGTLAVLTAAATFTSKRSFVITGAQLGLPDTGTGTGNTTVVVKVNGTAVNGSGSSVAGAATGKSVAIALTPTSPAGNPSGVSINPGDVVTVDVTAVPGTTAPKGGAVYLDVVQRDI